MKVNNVRARLTNNGNLFYKNFEIGYETPAYLEPNVTAIYEAGIWIGAKDKSGNIKVSAATHQNKGNDFFAGPLDINGATDQFICNQWDKIFSVKGSNIRQHVENYKNAKENGTTLGCDDISEDILYWPAQGNPYFEEKYGWQLPDQPLAGYADIDHNGFYDPCFGDFPMLYGENCIEIEQLIPTEINYFVFNDNGGPQKLTESPSMQMELHVNAYAYATKNALNDMTFYQYKAINKSSEDLLDCYFAFWVDPDLGCYNDDYFGCDPDLGMAYIYNADAMDGDENLCFGNRTYGNDIPVLGFDFVKGPWVTKNFKRNMDGSIVFDEKGDKILIRTSNQSSVYDTLVREQMSSFSYSINNPIFIDEFLTKESDFYRSMQGFWSDGTPITYGGTGYNPGNTDTLKYVFPHYPNDSQGWSMCTALLPYADRNFLMSVGPTIMQSGQTNDFTMVIFSVFDLDYPCPDLSNLNYTDKLIQDLFDNCASDLLVLDAPDAPEINTLSRVALIPNPAISSYGQLKLVLNGLPENSLVQVLDQNGQSKWQSRGDGGENIQYIGPGVITTSFDINGVGLHTGLYLVKITNMQTGESKSLKWILF